ncbi:MAG TPA: alpha-galactosidase [Capsulimonadaceae bacterium]|jgi:alpha-galactosidase
MSTQTASTGLNPGFAAIKSIAGAFGSRIDRFGPADAAVVDSPGTSGWTATVAPDVTQQATLTLVGNRCAVLSVTLVNGSGAPGSVVRSRIFDLLLKPQAAAYHAFRASGGLADGHYPPENYRTQEVIVETSLVNCTPPGGRSSDRNVPVTMVAADDGSGVWFSLEWSGMWHHILHTSRDLSMSVEAKLGFDITLAAGESLTLPDVHFGFFDGGFESGTNSVRRYLYDNVCASYLDKPVLPPLSYDHWFGIEHTLSDAGMRKQVDRSVDLGLEFFVVDAGWFVGDFPHGAGNWQVIDKNKFPNGLKPLADYTRSRGMKFGLWFEPERAERESDWAKRYPEMFIDIGRRDLHLNLARRDAQDMLIENIGGIIGDVGIEWSRWDYNIDPAPYWEKIDPSQRIQLAYFDGLNRVLDTLMAQYPTWFVENCASGGRRLDIATMRRAHTCWFSDETFSASICRYMQLQAASFLPGHLCNSSVAVPLDGGDKGFDEHSALSRMAGAFSFDGDIASWSPALTATMASCVAAYKRTRHLLVQDFYRLTPTPSGPHDWDVAQFVAHDQSEATVFAFRSSDGPSSLIVKPRGLADRRFTVTDALTGRGVATASGGVEIELAPNSGTLLHIVSD